MKKTSLLGLSSVVLLSFLVRVAVSLIATDIIDVRNYEIVANMVLSKGIIPGLYSYTRGIYPYPPLWVWLEVLARVVASSSGISFGVTIRLPVLVADCGIVAVLWAIGNQRTTRHAMLYGLLYGLNPVPIVVSCLHGQFDALPILFSLLSVHLILRSQRVNLSAIMLSAAIALKSFPALFVVPCLFEIPTSRKRVAFGMLATLPVAFMMLPFILNSSESVQRELLAYRGAALLGLMVPVRTVYVPVTGSSFPLDLTLRIITFSGVIFLMLYTLVAAQAMPKRSLTTRIVMTIALFYSVYAGIAPQYLVWIVPFLILDYGQSPLAFWLYTVTATLALIGFYSYAIPTVLLLNVAQGTSWSRILYGFGGTVWWLSSIFITIRCLGFPRV